MLSSLGLNKRFRLSALLALIVLVSAVLRWSHQEPGNTETHDREITTVDKVNLGQILSTKALDTVAATPNSLPETLKGSEVIAQLATDEDGNLRLSSDVRAVFDYYLSAIEEESLETVIARIQHYLDNTLEEPALTQARELLQQYLSLKMALFEYEQEQQGSINQLIALGSNALSQSSYVEQLQAQFEARTELRQTYLTPEVHQAFYGNEEGYDRYTLARLDIQSDTSLSAEQKMQLIESLDLNTDPEIIAQRKSVQLNQDIEQKTQEIMAAGGDSEALRSMRIKEYGEEAAERFESLDQERLAWKKRVDTYLDERKKVLDLKSGNEVDSEAIQALREQHFEGAELIRIQAYERMHDQSQTQG